MRIVVRKVNLDSPTCLEIRKFLKENPDRALTRSGISRELSADYTTVCNCLRLLLEAHVIHGEEGNTYRFGRL